MSAEEPVAERSFITPFRVGAFSDGVFAIAITLLALQLEVPLIKDPHSAGQLRDGLGDNLSSFAYFFVSFAVIGIYWMAHHRLFHEIAKADETLVLWNLGILLGISFLPYATTVLSRYDDNSTAIVFYASTVIVTSLMFLGLSMHAKRAGLYRPDTPESFLRDGRLRSLMVVGVFAASIALAPFSPHAATVCWVLLAFVSVAARLVGERHQRRDASDQESRS
jgi:TMEM175 potassium channel family protein